MAQATAHLNKKNPRLALGASEALSAAIALPALCSSKKATLPLINRRQINTPKSSEEYIFREL
jgi:hypothetical protein